MRRRVARGGFTLVELLAGVAIIGVLGALLFVAGWKAYEDSSLAVSANNIRQLAAGSSSYLADNNYVYWRYRFIDPSKPPGVTWWFGFEPAASFGLPEGQRTFKPEEGPLGNYIPAGFRPDPSFRFTGKPFKPKYRFGYIGVGYNVLLGGGWLGTGQPFRYWSLDRPGEIVVFATSAQVNTFQSPASPRNPMIEEFYGLDQNEVTVHFRHAGFAMVAFANGSAGLLEMDESTRDRRAPKANVGRFAPIGSTKYLRP
jgi:prepilin-type N-terminal cleavage/methylation domain-containing protein